MRKPAAVVIGAVLLLLFAGAGALWWLRSPPPPPKPPTPPRTARRQLAATPPAPPQGALQVRGRVQDLQGHPVSGMEVSASVALPGETLTELPCDADSPGVSLASEDCASVSAGQWLRELVEAHRGGAFILARTASAPDGTFTLEDLPRGRVAVWALGPQGSGVQEDVATGTQDVTLTLVPSHALTGRVVDEDGAPLADAQVTVLHTGTARYFETRTRADGHFSVGPLPDGDTYSLLAAHPGKLTAWLQDLAAGPLPEDILMYTPRRIVGTVVDGEQPVAGATVTEADGERVATTDAQGLFTFDGLAPGDYRLDAEQGGLQARETVTVTEDLRETRVTLRLGTAFFVEATVHDSTGAPVANAEVSADLPSEASAHFSIPIFQALGTTDANGRVRVGPLQARPYTFQVVADRLLDLTAVRTVAAGGPPLDFVLSPALLVEGHVTDAAGKPVAEANLSLLPAPLKRPQGAPPPTMPHPPLFTMHPPREVPLTYDATTDEHGHFAIKVDQALTGMLSIEANGFLPRKLQVRAPSADLKLTLDAGATVRGSVTNSRGAPVTEVDILLVTHRPEEASSRKADDDGSGGEPDEDPAEDEVERSTFAGSAEEDGHFVIQGVPPGTYSVWLRANQGGYERLLPERVTVRGSETVELSLHLDLDGRLGGIVVDTEGRPLAGVAVDGAAKEEEASGGRAYSPLSARTGPDGRFVLEPLVRDWDYELTAMKPGYAMPGARDEPELESGDENESIQEARARMDRWLEAQEGPKVIARAGNMDVRITLTFQGRVTGRLVKTDGTPITRFSVNEEPVRDPRGVFTVFVDDPGPQHLSFQVPGHAITQRDVVVPAGRDVDLGTVRIDTGHVVKGRVVDDATGAPLGGVSVSLDLPPDAPGEESVERGGILNVFTGPDGTFDLPAVEARPYVLTVQEAEHVSLQRTLGPNEDTVELRLQTSIRLEVTVTDDRGQPRSLGLIAIPKDEPGTQNITIARQGVGLFRDLSPGDYLVKPADATSRFTVLPRLTRVEARRVNRVDLPVSTRGPTLKLRWSERGMQGTPYLLPGRVPAPREVATSLELEWLRQQALPLFMSPGDSWSNLPPGPYTLLVLREREGRWLSFRQDVMVGTGDVQQVEVPALPW
ncbi:carboxypeptidase regulatory-like domain-containing protein [Corallococcus silvisoli]|uniref:carboxypeptidase regulatory-like domain-containing protein n=1 Tax=Corallococcus silvisoli TaxID=2697031 RepID=UPI0013783138|nr:carboxypeptidase regulatory-like domain-containing protein [Corallococcus silvisoli]NBD12939.1 hypothetical protein [Corallococcus silvisoli]